MYELLDSEENTQDFYEIVEFVRMGVLFIQETLTAFKTGLHQPDSASLAVEIFH